MNKRALLSTLVLAAVATSTLAGCSAGQDAPKPSASPSASASAAVKPAETVYDKCVDGSATILTTNTEKGKKFSLGDCANVSIVGAGSEGSTFELGAVETLVIEGDEITATVADAKKIIVAGQKNTISYGGSPEIIDDGEGNKVAAE